jgi:hypothetical protein
MEVPSIGKIRGTHTIGISLTIILITNSCNRRIRFVAVIRLFGLEAGCEHAQARYNDEKKR